jgi:hypothetical protein
VLIILNKIELKEPLMLSGESLVLAELRDLFARGLEDLGGEIARRVPFGPAGEIVDSLGERFADHIGEDSPNFLAECSLDLDSDGIKDGLVEIPLHLIQTILSSQHLKLSDKREARRGKAKTYRKGTQVGHLTLEMKVE